MIAQLNSYPNRLATAHTALTTHLTHQSRTITTLTHPLISPLAIPPSPEMIDLLNPMLTTLIHALPQPPSTPLPSIHALTTSTSELLSTLSTLSDTLHMMRQTTTLATRRLRTAKESLGTMKKEMDEAEIGLRYIEIGDWDKSLRERKAQRVCKEVVDGFEKVCDGWRDKLVAMSLERRVEVGAA